MGSITAPSRPLVARGRRPHAPTPISMTEVHRSACANKYNGFRVLQVTDTRPTSSKVKPRVIPSAGSTSSADDMPPEEIPPPTPINVIQEIGINRCAVPAKELTEEALLAGPATATELSAGTPPPGAQEEGSTSTTA